MYAGRKRNRIKIMRQVTVGTTGYGEPNFQDVLWKETWAEIEAKRGREHLSGEQVFALSYFNFTCRYFSVEGIETSMWIVHRGQRFDIQNILPDFQRRDHVVIETRARNLNDTVALEINLPVTPAAGEVGQEHAGIEPKASGGITPYAYSISSGSLPTGMSIDGGTGAITGTPTAAGTYSFVVRVTDAASQTADLPEIEVEVTA